VRTTQLTAADVVVSRLSDRARRARVAQGLLAVSKAELLWLHYEIPHRPFSLFGQPAIVVDEPPREWTIQAWIDNFNALAGYEAARWVTA
jgi:hypothetical protein